MHHGFIKVGVRAPKLKVADAEYNARVLLEEMAAADAEGVEILVFPELCISGATCGDLFFQQALINQCLTALQALVKGTEGKNLLAFVGLPFFFEGALYNCAAAIKGGKLLALVPKHNFRLSGHDGRYFAVGADTVGTAECFGAHVPFGTNILLRAGQVCVACEIGEDLYAPDAPSSHHALAGANVIVNLCAEEETVCRDQTRRLLAGAQSEKLSCAYLLACAGEGESTTDGVYAGHCLVAEDGEIVRESLPFEGNGCDCEIDVEALCVSRRKKYALKSENYVCVPVTFEPSFFPLTREVIKNPFLSSLNDTAKERILTIQARALARRIAHTGAKSAVIGISGGLDSTLAFLVAVRAFDFLQRSRKEIVAITMPGFGTTDATKGHSLRLMQELGATAKTVDIVPSVRCHFLDIEHDERDRGVTYENAQARMRTLVLMDVANKTGGLVVGTGDLSELALGWCTYNGDHMSMYAVNAGIPKTLVKELVRYEGDRLGGNVQSVLNGILSTEISPELLPPDEKGQIAQKTEDLVGPYELHDFYLYHCIKNAFSPSKILYLAQEAFGTQYSKETLKKWLRRFYGRFFSQQFKRSCSPDGVKVCAVGVSPRGEWQMPSDACVTAWLDELECE